MLKNAAVVAHFDANNRLEHNFKEILHSLEKKFDVIILVTTSLLPKSEVSAFSKITLIQRPNIGYDFYSYRVGLDYLYQNTNIDKILLTNSSFAINDINTFNKTLDLLLESYKYEVIGITESTQFSWHIQSYMLLLKKSIAYSAWFKEFIYSIQPCNTKFETILNYEIGLSQVFLKNKIETHTLFNPTILQRMRAELSWLKVLVNKNGLLSNEVIRQRKAINWTHFGSREIARQFGIIKTELLRTNPHRLPIDFIPQLSPKYELQSIRELISNSQKHYTPDSNGLTTLVKNSHSAPSIGLFINYGVPNIKGVRIAVVIHLYYYDILDEACTYLNNIIEPFDLYITTPFEGDVHKIINSVADKYSSTTIFVTENKGRDIAPFISLFLSGVLDNYMAILKIHSKKSKYSANGGAWRKQLFDKVIGNSLDIRRTIALFEAGNVGLVGPHEFYLSHDRFWGANYNTVKNLLTLSGSISIDQEVTLGFFAGTMFWFNPKALNSIKKIPLKNLCFEEEDGRQDGTLAHSIERIFCSIAKSAGYIVTTNRLSGADISNTETSHNRVPVL